MALLKGEISGVANARRNKDIKNEELKMKKALLYSLLVCICLSSQGQVQPLKVSSNGRYFMTADGKPFFWLGDTGWLLFSKLTREEAIQYLNDRKQKGFNVIQVMVLHTTSVKNAYGDVALKQGNVATPHTTRGNDVADTLQYDFWDHVDYIVDAAAERGIYMAMVPIWGGAAKAAKLTAQQATTYAAFLANRYKNKTNIIWLKVTAAWKAIGNTLYKKDGKHLITFHPRGRTSSTAWFHNEPWLQFNMFQSGHRRYDQDTSAGDLHYGEDNWKFVQADYAKKPVKPTLDGEPSYEQIPHGLHDVNETRWTDADVRRYGYWSVFAGGCGYTYGHNAVMQMHRKGDKDRNFGVMENWYDAIHAPGAQQMIHLKELMLSKSYFDRLPDQSLIAGDQREKYNRLLATRGIGYALVYTYTGRNMKINVNKVSASKVKASWFNPRTGQVTAAGEFDTANAVEFDPPGEEQPGNDWVLVLERL
jgi:hypothetical protein